MLSNTSKRASMPVHANSARKQKTREVLPDASPTDRPVRDVSATNMSISINHLQRYTNQENGGSKGVINDEEILMEANLLYTRHFKAIGRLFGKEDMDFTEQRQRIQQLLKGNKNKPVNQTKLVACLKAKLEEYEVQLTKYSQMFSRNGVSTTRHEGRSSQQLTSLPTKLKSTSYDLRKRVTNYGCNTELTSVYFEQIDAWKAKHKDSRLRIMDSQQRISSSQDCDMLKKENSSYCLQLEELDNEVRIMRMELQALDAQLREKEQLLEKYQKNAEKPTAVLSLTAQAKEIEKLLVELHTSNTKINYLEHVLVEEQEMRERHSLKVQRPSMYEDYQGGQKWNKRSVDNNETVLYYGNEGCTVQMIQDKLQSKDREIEALHVQIKECQENIKKSQILESTLKETIRLDATMKVKEELSSVTQQLYETRIKMQEISIKYDNTNNLISRYEQSIRNCNNHIAELQHSQAQMRRQLADSLAQQEKVMATMTRKIQEKQQDIIQKQNRLKTETLQRQQRDTQRINQLQLQLQRQHILIQQLQEDMNKQTVQCRGRIEELNKDIAEQNEVINIERDKLGLLTNEKYDLEQEINQFKAALNMMSENNEKLVQENALVVTERDHCSKQIAELRQEKEEYEQIIARQREYIEEMTEKCTRIEESKSQQQIQCREQYRIQAQKLTQELQRWKEEVELHKKDIERYKEQIYRYKQESEDADKLKQNAQRYRQERDRYLQELKRYDVEIQRYQLEVDRQKREVEKCNQTIETQSEEMERYKDMEKYGEKVEQCMIEIQRLKEELSKFKEVVDNKQEELDIYKEENERCKDEIEKGEVALKELIMELDRHKEEIVVLDDEIKRYKAGYEGSEKDMKKLLMQLERQKEYIVAREEEINNYKQQINNYKQQMNQCKVDIDQYMTELMSCKEQARIEKERADKVKIELIRYQKEVQEGIKERKQESMKEIESFNEEIDILKEELSMSAKDKFEIHKLYGYIEGHKNEIKTLTIQLARVQGQLQSSQSKIEWYREQLTKYNFQIGKHKEQDEQNKQLIKEINQKLAMKIKQNNELSEMFINYKSEHEDMKRQQANQISILAGISSTGQFAKEFDLKDKIKPNKKQDVLSPQKVSQEPFEHLMLHSNYSIEFTANVAMREVQQIYTLMEPEYKGNVIQCQQISADVQRVREKSSEEVEERRQGLERIRLNCMRLQRCLKEFEQDRLGSLSDVLLAYFGGRTDTLRQADSRRQRRQQMNKTPEKSPQQRSPIKLLEPKLSTQTKLPTKSPTKTNETKKLDNQVVEPNAFKKKDPKMQSEIKSPLSRFELAQQNLGLIEEAKEASQERNNLEISIKAPEQSSNIQPTTNKSEEEKHVHDSLDYSNSVHYAYLNITDPNIDLNSFALQSGMNQQQRLQSMINSDSLNIREPSIPVPIISSKPSTETQDNITPITHNSSLLNKDHQQVVTGKFIIPQEHHEAAPITQGHITDTELARTLREVEMTLKSLEQNRASNAMFLNKVQRANSVDQVEDLYGKRFNVNEIEAQNNDNIKQHSSELNKAESSNESKKVDKQMSKSCLSSNNRTITQQNTVETNISSQKPVINILSPAKPIEQHIINAQNKEIKLHELRRSASTIPRIVYGQPQVPHQTIYHAQQAQPCSPQSMPYQQRMFERKPSGQIIRQEVQQPRQSASIVFQPLTEAQKSAQIYAQALGPIMRQSQLPLSPPVGRSSHRYSKKSNEDSSTDSKGDISRNIIYQQPRSMSRGITRIRPVPAGPPVTLAVLQKRQSSMPDSIVRTLQKFDSVEVLPVTGQKEQTNHTESNNQSILQVSRQSVNKRQSYYTKLNPVEAGGIKTELTLGGKKKEVELVNKKNQSNEQDILAQQESGIRVVQIEIKRDKHCELR